MKAHLEKVFCFSKIWYTYMEVQTTMNNEKGKLNILENITLLIKYSNNHPLAFHKLKRKNFQNSVVTKYPSKLKTNTSLQDNFEEAIARFKQVLLSYFTFQELTNFYHNLASLEVDFKNFRISNFLFNEHIVGVYKAQKNKIFITEDTFKSAIFHELFHMASTRAEKDTIYSGFSYSSYDSVLGKGLNEGYTELLNQRYFNPDNYAYFYLTVIAANLEQIIGQKRMRYLYMTSNLGGLINDLRKYFSKEEILKFIASIDAVKPYLNEEKISKREWLKIKHLFQEINKFLILCYGEKLQNLYQDETIRKKEFDQFSAFLVTDFLTQDHSYEILSDQEIDYYCHLALTPRIFQDEERGRRK